MKKISVHPLFVVFCAVLIYLGYLFVLLAYVITIILHELAHSIMAQKLGYRLNQIQLMPYGASISGQSHFFSTKDEILVAIAGPFANIVLAIICCALWWIFPSTYFITQQFVYANTITALINCLPIFPLDGGRVLLAILSKKGNRNKAIFRVRNLGIGLSSFLIVGFFITAFFVPNYTLLVFGAFLFVSSILENKNSYYDHIGLFENKINYLQKGLKLREIAILDTTKLYKLLTVVTPDSLTNFNVIDKNYKVLGKIKETDLEKLIKIYPANTTLGLIVQN